MPSILLKPLRADNWNQRVDIQQQKNQIEWNTLSNTQTRSSLRSTVCVCVGLGEALQVCSLSQRMLCAACILVIHSAFAFLHWHREDAPEALPSQTPPASKILKGEEKSKAQATPVPAARQRETGGGARIGRQQERKEPAKVSDHCRDVSGGCSDFDTDQQLRQEGLINWVNSYYSLSQAVESTMQCPYFVVNILNQIIHVCHREFQQARGCQ